MMHLSKPKLPSYKSLQKYLETIDTLRHYTNSGPLLRLYEDRLQELFNCHVAATSSASSGLTASLIALGVKGEVIMPSWTFVATANAVSAVGGTPYFCDVNERNWSTYGSTYIKREHGFGIGVLPFGSPVPYVEIEDSRFIIDAAAAFDVYASGPCKAGHTPVVISTHATKCFSTAEGGLVLSTDPSFIHRVREIINHGITIDRDVPRPGINGKLSEYHAAIGLASLDEWPATRSRWMETKWRYTDVFKDFAPNNPLFDLSWIGPTFGIDIRRNVTPIIDALAAWGITARRIWGRGVHRYPASANCLCSPLPVTERLADEILFLPYWIDATPQEIKLIADAVHEAQECA